jgi:flagellar biosynthesis/type III secretory pathway M-ring protein FliF/YscJ
MTQFDYWYLDNWGYVVFLAVVICIIITPFVEAYHAKPNEQDRKRKEYFDRYIEENDKL